MEGCLLQGRGVAHGDTSAFPCLISLPARCSPSRPRSPTASCTPSPPSPRRLVESYCSSAPLEGRRTWALRLLAPPLRPLDGRSLLAPPPRHKALPLRRPLSPWLARPLRKTFLWTLRRSTSTCRPSPAAAEALSFPQLVRREGPTIWGWESPAASPALPSPVPFPSITRVSCGP